MWNVWECTLHMLRHVVGLMSAVKESCVKVGGEGCVRKCGICMWMHSPRATMHAGVHRRLQGVLPSGVGEGKCGLG